MSLLVIVSFVNRAVLELYMSCKKYCEKSDVCMGLLYHQFLTAITISNLIPFIKVSGNPCDDHNVTSIV